MPRCDRRSPWAVRPTALLALLTASLVLSTGQGVAAGAWPALGSRTVSEKAASVQQPSNLTVTVQSQTLLSTTYLLRWDTTLMSGQPVRAYTVRRTLNGQPSSMTDTTCDDGTVDGRPGVVLPVAGATSQSCTDTLGLTSGTYTWTVVPHYYDWGGPAAGRSITR